MNIPLLDLIFPSRRHNYDDYSAFMSEATDEQKLRLMKYAAQKATEEQRRLMEEEGKLESLHRLST